MGESMRYLITTGLLIASTMAVSADPLTDLKTCKAETDTQKRLACFDAINVETTDQPVAEKKIAPVTQVKAVLRIQRVDPQKRVYNPRIELIPTFKNDTKKTVVAIEHTLVVTDAFGDKIIDGVSKLDIKIPPGKTVESEQIYWWEDNQFIQNQPFDKLQGPVSTGVAKATLEVKKAVFSDGTSESY